MLKVVIKTAVMKLFNITATSSIDFEHIPRNSTGIPRYKFPGKSVIFYHLDNLEIW